MALAESSASYLARVRVATETEDLRQKYLDAVKVRVAEASRREKAEQAADDLAQMVAQAEAVAASAAEAANILRAELEQAAEEIQAAHTENQVRVAETKAVEAELMSRAQLSRLLM